MRFRGGRAVLGLVLTMVVLGGRARADDAAARRHYDAGAKAYNLQRFDEALAEFRAAYEERADAAFLFNIAQAQRQLGQHQAAARSYRAYLHEQGDAFNRADVGKLIDAMDAAARGDASPQPSVVVSAPAPIEVRDAGRAKRRAGLALGTIGVAGLALGITFAALSKQAGDDAYHPSSGVYDPAADERQRGYRIADIVGFAVGGGLIVSGATLWLVGHGERRVAF